MKRMCHQLQELEEKVKNLEMLEASQTRSPLAGAEQRRTPSANPKQTPVFSTSQKVKTKQINEPAQVPKGQTKEEVRKSVPSSNGPRLVEQVEQRQVAFLDRGVEKKLSPPSLWSIWIMLRKTNILTSIYTGNM
ncbi:hypothetical protein TSAR_005927 [Trichomalopsis sarcophagae]|uniref:Uncharacterized protein n=1 Tax=Trichomalopsis sarcophagae TaxID=543379 RepID=A0A232FDQ0_9HYME|nr:hypothetical protein TSAR_005927 [Trichomalopsis sarcophagae]